MKNLQEQKLLKQAIKGDAQAFSTLLEEYYMMIYSTAFKWTGNPEDSEDIAQEVCVKVGGAIRKFRMESKFSTWLYRIVINTAKDFQRKKRNHSDIDDVPEIAMADHHSAETHVENAELWQSVQKLPEKQREAILLVYAEGLTHGEVASIMACKESTVSWYIHEAKKQLKILIDENGR
jgi:RNA polymerase sigma-70 factor (ECF subfamily)